MERDTNPYSNDAPVNPIEQALGLFIALAVSMTLVAVYFS